MDLDNYLIRNREATFMLRVKGDSMRDAGIMEGDMVLVERGVEAKPGQIIITEVDGSWRIRYLQKGEKGLHISAVVTAMIRKY